MFLIPQKLGNISSVKLHCQSFKIFTVSLLIGCLGVSPFYGHCLEAILNTFDKIYMLLFHVEYHLLAGWAPALVPANLWSQEEE